MNTTNFKMPDLLYKQHTADSSLLIPLSRQGESFVKFHLYKQPQIIEGDSLAYVIPSQNSASVMNKISSLRLNLKIGASV